MSTYGPEVTFDLPSGDERVQQLVEVADLTLRDTRHYRDGQVDEDLARAVKAAVAAATNGEVPLEAFDLHTIDSSTTARVEIVGSFTGGEPLSKDFEAFATQGGKA